MMNVPGSRQQFCDGMTRRSMLKIGGLAMGGLSLPQLLQAEAASGRKSHKAVIMVFLSGGPPHQDMVDLKVDAPVEIRGEFQPIATNVPGIDICEHLPLLAQRMDRLAIIRSLVGSEGRHAAFQCMTGHSVLAQPPGGWPSLGAAVSKLQGPLRSGTMPFVSLSPRMKNGPWGDPGQAGFAGQAHAPFSPNAEEARLGLSGISVEGLRGRRSLLNGIDRLKREVEQSGALDGFESQYWWKPGHASSRWHMVGGTGTVAHTGPILRTRATTCRCSIKVSPHCSTICTNAGWMRMSASSCGVSSDGRRSSTRTAVAIIGLKWAARCWREAE